MYYFYILRCSDSSLYSGIAKNPHKRVEEHNSNNSKAAKYTRSRRPVKLVYIEECSDRSIALKREAEIKKWPKTEKENLVKNAEQIYH
jgi:putative endonuclease